MTMNDTAIAWTNLSWNPNSGCRPISPGCGHCYAMEIAEKKRGTAAFRNGFDLTLRPHKLREPYRVKTPSLIFVNSMSDFAWEELTDEWRDRIVDVIEDTPQHQYQVLTKRDENLLRYSRRRKLPPNFWAGVSVENQAFAHRIDTLRQIDVEIRFVSMEPMLGRINHDLSGISWVITGGESGAHLSKPRVADSRALVERIDGRWVPRADRVDWVRLVRDRCIGQGVKHFFKQWGGPRPDSGGRILDGRTWDEFPRLPEGGAVNYRLASKSLPVVNR